MKIHIINSANNFQIFETDLVIIPGMGTKVHLPNHIVEQAAANFIKSKRTHLMISDGGYDRGNTVYDDVYSSDDIEYEFSDNCYVLATEICVITGDVKVLLGSRAKASVHTATEIKNTASSNNSRNTNNDDDFLDTFLVAGAIMSMMD